MNRYPYISRFIRQLNHSGVLPLDTGHPGGISGEQYWFTFEDRATAERFQHDLLAFAQHWDPEDADRRAREMLEYQRPGMVIGKPGDLTIPGGSC